jgi:sensor histidine kinase regulating citrate/malate metabolism
MKANNSELKKLNKSLKTARRLLNEVKYGTHEFQQTIGIIRILTDKIDDLEYYTDTEVESYTNQ